MNWIKILSLEDYSAGNFIRLIRVKGKKICLVKVGDEFFATQSRCPHAGADLSQGFCKDKKLICAFHRYEYDLQTGRGAPGQGDYINIYPLEQREDGLYIGLKEKWNFIKKLFDL
ncbi:Rieske (2Fe-2S) protein [Flavihumibacter sp. R14]|nr:Rieske (2Fe-2S) protein [Flavihumibacter soli]